MNGRAALIGAAAVAGFAWWWWARQRAAAQDAASQDASAGDSGSTSLDLSNPGGTVLGVDISAALNQIGNAMGLSPKGIRNNNPGNLRYVPSISWRGQVGDDGTGYAVFDSPENGIRALGRQLTTYSSRGLATVRKIISTYAPSNENDTAAYTIDVSRRLGVTADEPMDVYNRLPELCAAIIAHENGQQPYAMGDIEVWVYE